MVFFFSFFLKISFIFLIERNPCIPSLLIIKVTLKHVRSKQKEIICTPNKRSETSRKNCEETEIVLSYSLRYCATQTIKPLQQLHTYTLNLMRSNARCILFIILLFIFFSFLHFDEFIVQIHLSLYVSLFISLCLSPSFTFYFPVSIFLHFSRWAIVFLDVYCVRMHCAIHFISGI